MLEISEIYLFKQTKSTGLFTIKFVVEVKDNEYDLTINHIKLDISDTIDPISFYKVNGQQLLTGTYYDILKRMLLKLFKNCIYSDNIGMYKYSSVSKEVEKV
jgi:hypothetical protein